MIKDKVTVIIMVIKVTIKISQEDNLIITTKVVTDTKGEVINQIKDHRVESRINSEIKWDKDRIIRD